MKKCKRCDREKTWSGSGIECPFSSGENFTNKNWNCGAIGWIRNLANIAMDGGDPRLHYRFCDDQKYATIDISDIYEDIDTTPPLGMTLWVTWYKSRGRTESMWILDCYDPPRVPTFKELELIKEHYKDLL